MQNQAPPAAEAPASSTVVAVTRRIAAPAEAIFRLLATPQRHVDLDGSGMVRHAVTMEQISGVGDVFVMAMHQPELGKYEMNNLVVEYEQDRRIGWEPEAGRGHPNTGTPAARWGQRWTFVLVPDGPDATLVTESYDCTRVPPAGREKMHNGNVWVDAITASLQRLDHLCKLRPIACSQR
jgi:uncharacterized protein YndB with AHSA1/START domain